MAEKGGGFKKANLVIKVSLRVKNKDIKEGWREYFISF